MTETVAYDVGALCEFAHELKRRTRKTRCSALFLELDQPLRRSSQELGLQGIRKAQVKLAATTCCRRREQGAAHLPTTWPASRRDRLRAIRERARARRDEGLLGDHRPRPQLRVHAAAAKRGDGAVLRLVRRKARAGAQHVVTLVGVAALTSRVGIERRAASELRNLRNEAASRSKRSLWWPPSTGTNSRLGKSAAIRWPIAKGTTSSLVPWMTSVRDGHRRRLAIGFVAIVHQPLDGQERGDPRAISIIDV